MKPKSLTILFSSLLLTSCASVPNAKYISWEKGNQDYLDRICPKKGLFGCAWQSTQHDGCKIYSLDSLEPFSVKEQYVVGHEAIHCFKGDFHK